MKKLNPSSLVLFFGIVIVVAITIIYILLYQIQPLVQPWNDVWLYAIFFISAALAAIPSTMVALQFRKGDQPRRVWIDFSLGLWCWALAELVWMILGLTVEDIGSVTLADLFWVVAYVFFALSFARQYDLIFSTPRKRQVAWLAGIAIGGVLISIMLTALLHGLKESEQTWFETFVVAAYPVADVIIGIAALRLSHLFGRGLWGRVWWGMVFFVVSDTLYTWLDFSGIYALSVETGNPISLITDVIYFDAYLLVGLACLSQWLLMRYGPRRQKIAEVALSDE